MKSTSKFFFNEISIEKFFSMKSIVEFFQFFFNEIKSKIVFNFSSMKPEVDIFINEINSRKNFTGKCFQLI